ncbi:MAG: hypothetical protein M3440_10750 [Chloroflexota bacterium]|nr:hypothetical protein [Chloroflexota bacterium]
MTAWPRRDVIFEREMMHVAAAENVMSSLAFGTFGIDPFLNRREVLVFPGAHRKAH